MSAPNPILACLESEKALLGTVLINEEHFEAVQSRTVIEDFFLSSHRDILRAITSLKAQQKIADAVTVIEELQRTGRLEAVGGYPYIGGLIDAAPDQPNVDAYVRNIRDAARARAFHSAASLACTAIEQGESFDDVLRRLEGKQEQLKQSVTSSQNLFLSAPEFIADAPEKICWLVEGLIERGANGFFSAVPKGGKSWAAIDLAISLALGCDWLGFRVPQAVKVALVSREDNPSLTAWRMQKLFAGKSCPVPELIELNLHVNSRRQSAELMLDQPQQMAHLMAQLRALSPRFVIFDVFNVLHAADENDNQEMRTVLRQLSRIQAEIGCAIAVVHHYNKSDHGSMTQRLRGSSAIAGWAEWLIGISMADEESKTRRMEFELKAAEPPDPIHYRIESTPGMSRLERVSFSQVARATREGSAAERLMSHGVAAD